MEIYNTEVFLPQSYSEHVSGKIDSALNDRLNHREDLTKIQLVAFLLLRPSTQFHQKGYSFCIIKVLSTLAIYLILYLHFISALLQS